MWKLRSNVSSSSPAFSAGRIENKKHNINERSPAEMWGFFGEREMEKVQITIDQHTTPRCYLKNFSEDGTFIYRKRKETHTREESKRNSELKRPLSLNSATIEEHFYTVNSIANSMLIEKDIYANTIENEYTSIYDFLTNPSIQEFDMEQRTKMFFFFMTLHTRTPKQFELFSKQIPLDFHFEIDKIKEDYKVAHIIRIADALVKEHGFKTVSILKLTDSSEFITSDNPVLIVGLDNQLKNNEWQQHFNSDNLIFIPIERKHCCVLSEFKDKNGIPAKNRVFINRISRADVDVSFASQVNLLMLDSADKCYLGSKQFMGSFFELLKFV